MEALDLKVGEVVVVDGTRISIKEIVGDRIVLSVREENGEKRKVVAETGDRLDLHEIRSAGL